MNWITVLALSLQLIIKIYDASSEKNAKKKKLKKEALKDATDALTSKNASKFTRALDRLNSI